MMLQASGTVVPPISAVESVVPSASQKPNLAAAPFLYPDKSPTGRIFAQLEAMKQLARRRNPRRVDQDDQNADGQNAGVEPVTTKDNRLTTSSAALNQVDRSALMRQIGELYTRLPNHFATANVLGHTEAVPDTNILIRGDWRNKGEKVEPAFPPALNPGRIHRKRHDRPPHYDSMTYSDLKITVYGNTAVLTANADVKLLNTRLFRVRTLHVYVETDGQWRLVAHESTRVAQ